MDLENQILGLEREGDLPGEMIPYYYFEYLRTQQAFQLVPIFHHNVMDIVSLACLTAVVPFAFRSPEDTSLRHGADLVGLARWLSQADRHEEAVGYSAAPWIWGSRRSALQDVVGDRPAGKEAGAVRAALAVYTDLAAAKNPYRVRRSKSWPNITSAASVITEWRWR